MQFTDKAGNLQQLQGQLQHASIPLSVSFSHREWRSNTKKVLDNISSIAAEKLIIRSSAFGEDGESDAGSMAGCYLSLPNIPSGDEAKLVRAIEMVFASYGDFDYRDRILIQPMLDKIVLTAVALTCDPRTSLPYYVIDYDDETGLSHTITSGCNIPKKIIISKNANPTWLPSVNMRNIVRVLGELTQITGSKTLDVELVIDTDSRIWVLQVRPLHLHRPIIHEDILEAKLNVSSGELEAASAPHEDIWGANTIFSDMTDWNPAEMIGTSPSPLALSLYKNLITDDIWQQGRALMGYRPLPGRQLMVTISGHPYIDARRSFNSFLPADLPRNIGEKIINAWIDRLMQHRELSDKAEFQICLTCFVPTHDNVMQERYPDVLTESERQVYRNSLLSMTNAIVHGAQPGSLAWCEGEASKLAAIQNLRNLDQSAKRGSYADQIINLLTECRRHGTLSFSVAARHAFIGEHIFRTFLEMGVIDAEDAQEFRSSIITVAGQLARAISQVTSDTLKKDVFLKTYGHIRPNSYDISSKRYDSADGFPFLRQTEYCPEHKDKEKVDLHQNRILAALGNALPEAGYAFSGREFLQFFVQGLQLRESIKFVFMRNVSDILELLTQWGREIGYNTEAMAQLTVADIEAHRTGLRPLDETLMSISSTAKSHQGIRMNNVIADRKDMYVIPIHSSRPNFVTQRKVTAPIVCLRVQENHYRKELAGKIVCIERADPGFDWIFSHKISGLITKYGGSNSHMAIRCAEFMLPAAIGCGEVIYEHIIRSEMVELNAADEIVMSVAVLQNTRRPHDTHFS